MKNSFYLALALSFVFVSCSKNSGSADAPSAGSTVIVPASSVPSSARTALATNFPGASEIEWERNSSSSFTSQFNQNNQRHSAGFDDNGNQRSHSVICLDAPVPQVVLDAFRQQFSSDSVYEWKHTNDGNWKAHFMRGAVKYEATFSASGSLLKFERSN
mgnify:CR=1 FL=1